MQTIFELKANHQYFTSTSTYFRTLIKLNHCLSPTLLYSRGRLSWISPPVLLSQLDLVIHGARFFQDEFQFWDQEKITKSMVTSKWARYRSPASCRNIRVYHDMKSWNRAQWNVLWNKITILNFTLTLRNPSPKLFHIFHIHITNSCMAQVIQKGSGRLPLELLHPGRHALSCSNHWNPCHCSLTLGRAQKLKRSGNPWFFRLSMVQPWLPHSFSVSSFKRSYERETLSIIGGIWFMLHWFKTMCRRKALRSRNTGLLLNLRKAPTLQFTPSVFFHISCLYSVASIKI